jgi:CHASE2 domain-containing sensor protein/nitrogen-specific signal transduction histidine kinase
LITLFRLSGLLQPLSFLGYDLLFITRPQRPPDDRIIIVSIQESDIQKYKQYPINDLILAELINKIKAQNAKVIGLDLYRDIPVPPGHEELIQIFKTTDNLIGIKKINHNQLYPSIPAPPILEESRQISASDVIIDQDGVLRRAILLPNNQKDPRLQSFGLAVALEYLIREKEIYPEASADGGWLQLKDTVFYPLKNNSGEYVGINTAEYQIMLDFRGLSGIFKKVSLADVLEERISSDLFTNKIVLIGMEATSVKDVFYTPYSTGTGSTPQLTYGVEIHANLASQILSAVLDGRPLIKTWSETSENLWIFLWILLPSLWAWKWRKHNNVIQLLGIIIAGSLGLSIILIATIYFSFILQGWWIPSLISLLGLWLSAISISLIIYLEQILDAKNNLEIRVEERTRELQETLEQLKKTQEQIIAQERLAYLGFLSAGIIHEIKNPVHIIDNFLDLFLLIEEEFQEIFQNYSDIFTEEDNENIENNLSSIKEYVETIEKQTLRIESILNSLLPNILKEKAPVTKNKINVNQLLDNANKLVYHSKKTEEMPIGLKLETNFDNSLEEIEIVPFELTQVLVNLIDNAYDSLCEKQQQIQDKNYIPLIRIASRNLPEAIEISIFDNGTGISSELKDKIFQPFFTTKIAGKGTGLGLSLARDFIVGKYSGNLTVESDVGNYTKFIIMLAKREKYYPPFSQS